MTPTETDIPVQGGERARTGYQHRTLLKGSKTETYHPGKTI